jgi:hypothetical protein
VILIGGILSLCSGITTLIVHSKPTVGGKHKVQ